MRWEYRTETLHAGGFFTGLVDQKKINDDLNRYGAHGWELVNIFDTNRIQGGTLELVAVLKRPLDPQ
ncbi:MAG TPA: DUF4177 domain-containing protein [Chthoniobacterales bacterium]|jgi:hypothetical protein